MFDYSTLDSEEIFALAKIDFQRKNYEASLVKLKALLSRNQIPLQAYSLLGRVYATIGIFRKAKECFQVFVKNNPNALDEKFQLGLVEKDMGNDEAALEQWDSILETAPKFAPALFQKARVLIDKEDKGEAIELLNYLLETAPEGHDLIAETESLLSKINLQ